MTVVVDTVAGGLLSFSVSGGRGQFVANFGTRNDAHLATVAIYRVPAGGSLNAMTHLIKRYAVAPGMKTRSGETGSSEDSISTTSRPRRSPTCILLVDENTFYRKAGSALGAISTLAPTSGGIQWGEKNKFTSFERTTAGR